MNPYAESAYFVAKNPKHCFIDYAQIFVLAQKFVDQNLQVPSWREPVYPESDDEIIEFFGVINSDNFCFTDFKTHKKFDIEYPEGSGKIWSGAFGMTMCFKRALNEGIPILTPTFLARITEELAKYIFRHKTTPIPMLSERVENLRNVGYVLMTCGTSFRKIFEVMDYQFLDIVKTVSGMFSSYSDFSQYQNHYIKFNKRAQLFPMMYHGRALSSNGVLQPIRDPENFGPVADYEVPKILRMFGAISYSPELAAKVDNGVVIPKDSPEEIEIRAMTVVAMEQILNKINFERQKKELREKGLKEITIAELDYAVWNMGRSPEYKALRHHYTYTTAY